MAVSDMWSKLNDELDRWGAEGKTATFWWRDDDAEEYTDKLDTMIKTAAGLPICLAVIPGRKDLKPLAKRLAPHAHISILQHGWKHTANAHFLHGEHSDSAAFAATWQMHAGGIRSEYPEFRTYEDVTSEIGAGNDILRDVFGAQALPVLVPPFHIYSDRFLSVLPLKGIPWISRGGRRRYWTLGFGVLDINIHVDLMDWGAKGLGDPRPKLDVMVEHLKARRTGVIDSAEPTGILTHHLSQDSKSWEFIAELMAITDAHKAKWLHGRDVFCKMSRTNNA